MLCRATIHLYLAAILGVATAGAQDFDVGAGPNTLEFSFSNPGARSMGVGGAFVALADDATAAYANPAGLVQLSRPEVSVEGRRWSYSTPFTVGGRVSGSPSGIGLDTTDGLRSSKSEEDVSGLSFVSFVYPKGRWAIALYRHELAHFRASTATQGLFGEGTNPSGTRRFLDQRVTTDLEVVSYAVAAAWRPTERLSLGAGVALDEGSSLSTFDTFTVDDPTDPQSFFVTNSYFPERRFGSLELRLDDNAVALNLGALWRVSDRFSIGGVFRQGPAFDFERGAFLSGPALERFAVPVGTVLDGAEESPLNLPDVYGLGAAYRSPNGAVTVSFEWDRVTYSAITDGFAPEAVDEKLTLFDADELRLGFEYVLLRTQPIVAMRLGAWLDPDHRFRYVSGDDSPNDDLSRALFTGGKDVWHGAAGVGIAFRHFQVDLAVDLSELRDTASISAIYAF